MACSKPESLPFADIQMKVGKRLAHPPPGEEVVISGISGRFPASSNIKEFQENLFNKIDMIGLNRWKIDHPHIPARAGTLKDITKFDCIAFGIHPRQADKLSPMTKLLLEVVFEAIYDAGFNPCEVENTKTGIFISSLNAGSEDPPIKHNLSAPKATYNELGRITTSNLISYTLKLNGPSCSMDTGCSTSVHSLEEVYRAIRSGKIDAAIIGGANIDLNPSSTIQYTEQGLLSPDGCCKFFDERANGYVRAETVSAIFVQKKKNARRIYCEVKHCKTGCDGFTEEGITFPSATEQAQLFSQLYNECNINPADVYYVEAHGTGTKAGDVQEATSIDNNFVKHRVNPPLLIGSVKSNMGHGEAVAGLCQIAKAITIMETGFITPNLHFHQPRINIEALQQGRLKVLTEITPFKPNGLLAVNSFGLGGSNGHVLLKPHDKIKAHIKNNFTRLIFVSGRTRDAVKDILENIISTPPDVEFFSLLNDMFRWNTPTHKYRGTLVLFQNKNNVYKSISSCDITKSNLRLVTGGFSSNLLDVGREILELPLGIKVYGYLSRILQLDFKKELIENKNSQLIAALVHLVIVHLIKTLDVNVEVINEFSIGTFAKAYSKGTVTFKEAAFCAILAINAKMELKSCKKDKKAVEEILRNLVAGDIANNFSDRNRRVNIKKIVFNYLLNNGKPQKYVSSTRTTSLVFGTSNVSTEEETSLFMMLSRLYQEGFNFDINKLYSDVHYPVGRQTPMISSLIRWDHTSSYKLPIYYNHKMFHKVIVVDTNVSKWNFLHSHVVDGKKVFPGTGYIYLVWDAFSFKNGKNLSGVDVVFEELHFIRSTILPQDGSLQFLVTISNNSGKFAVSEGGFEVLTGRVCVKHIELDDAASTQLKDKHTVMLNSDDVYKELRLRGYNYEGVFKGLVDCTADFEQGLIQWNNNWIAFVDNMCQMYVLTVPTRKLLVMSHIESITIRPQLHREENCLFSAVYCKQTESIRCGGVNIKRMYADVIHKKSFLKEPLLEEYKFVANEVSVSLEKSININMQIALENSPKIRIHVVEIADTAKYYKPVLHHVIDSFKRVPLVEIEATLLTDEDISIPNVTVKNLDVKDIKNAYMIIGSNLLQSSKMLHSAFDVLIEDGFVLSRECPSNNHNYSQVNVLTVHSTQFERIVLLSKQKGISDCKILHITDNFEWIESLQGILKAEKEVIIYSQKAPSGILGFTNCIRREGHNVRCVYICDQNAPTFDSSNSLYQEQLKTGHAINVFKNGTWGTYRHFPPRLQKNIKSEHCVFRSGRRKSHLNLAWTAGPLNQGINQNMEQNLVYVYYSALNFKDVLIANRKLRKSTMYGSVEDDSIGSEYSGKCIDGNRVMGICTNGDAIANLITTDKNLMLEIPNNWSLVDAATVPIAYATVLYAFKRGNVKKHHTILIHSGAGGVGQAAINISHALGMNIFVTTGSEAKKKFLQTAFPFLKPSQIGCSRDISFEHLIKRATKSKGVDVILNSLIKEKLEASMRCLAERGIYLEIQKFDASNNKRLPPEYLMKEIQFHGIFLDALLVTDKKYEIINLLKVAVKSGMVKPLHHKIFDRNAANKAFKFMSTGEHIGKLLIEIRKENKEPTTQFLQGIPEYYVQGSVVITGGCGGFGLELIDWLVNRGATKILAVNRKHTINGYLASRLRIWKQKQVEIKIVTDHIDTEEGCHEVLEMANRMAPLHSIFHIAAIFSEALFEHQTIESFKQSFAVKAKALHYLDRITRSSYLTLKNFVVFSSASSIRSVPGQTNYAFSNSTMEMICEERQNHGFPATAIQWGLIGDVGQLQRTKGEISVGNKLGLIPQNICSCLETLNDILILKPTVISSVVLKNKGGIANHEKSILNYVAEAIGISDLKKVNINATLAELGMDSIVATSIKQTLEREFNKSISFQDLRRQTLAGLEQLQAKYKSNTAAISSKSLKK